MVSKMQAPAKSDLALARPPGPAGGGARYETSGPANPLPADRKHMATRIVLAYLIFGILWVILSDILLNKTVPDRIDALPIGMVKGIIFILVTALLLRVLITRSLATISRSEKKVIESETRFQAVFDNALDAMVLLDREGRIVRINNTFTTWVGKPREEIEGRFYYDLVSPEFRPTLDGYWSELNEKGQVTGTFRNTRLAGAPSDAEFGAKSDVVPGFQFAVIRDISQRRVYERDIEAREHTYRVLMDQAAEGIFIADARGCLLDVNSRACEMLGYARSELVGMWVSKILEPVPPEETQASMERLRAGEPVSSERALIRKDGSTFPVQVSTRMIEDGRIQSIVLDITDRKRAEQALLRQNAELNALYETTLGLLSRLEPDDLIETILTRAASLLGTEHGFLYVEDPKSGELQLRVTIGILDMGPVSHLQQGQGISGKVWQTGEPMAIEDYQKWPDRMAGLQRPRATIAAPLQSGSHVIGVIGLAHVDENKHFAPDALKLLARLGQMAALALENARLFASAQQELGEKRRSEEQLRLSEERLKAQYKGNPIPTYSWQHTGGSQDDFVLIDYNDAAYASTGGRVAQMIGKRMRDFYASRPDIVADFEKCYRERTQVQREMEYTYVTTGHSEHQVVSFVFVPPDLVMLHAQDVSERIAYERSLEEHASEQARLLSQLLTAQEAERRRVSMDIHDGPLQTLGVSLMATDRAVRRLERSEMDLVERELRGLRATIAGTVAELRAVLADLSLDVLTTAGLEAALRDHASRFSDVTGIQVDFLSSLTERLPAQLELLMYRLAQEALSNIRKHSGATIVTIQLERDHVLHMTIEDNGEGFEPASVLHEVRAGHHIGLRSMQQRIEDAQGGMGIHSSPGRGTRLEFWCPLPEEPS